MSLTHSMTAHEVLVLDRLLGQIVQIGKDSIEDDVEWSPGMLARIVEVGIEHDMLVVELDTRGFENHNDQLLEKIYYDKNQKPTLNARDAGYWKDVDTWYLDGVPRWGSRMHMLQRLPVESFITYQFNEKRTCLSLHNQHESPPALSDAQNQDVLATAKAHPSYKDIPYWLAYHQTLS